MLLLIWIYFFIRYKKKIKYTPDEFVDFYKKS